MTQFVHYPKGKGLPARILAGLLLTVVIVGGLALAAAHSGEKLTGHEIPSGECTSYTSENNFTTVEELVRMAVGQLPSANNAMFSEPTNMADAIARAEHEYRGINLPPKGTEVKVCSKFGDPSMIASIGVNHDPRNLG